LHEIGLIQAVMDEITKAAEANNITRINKVRLVVGKMNGAIPDALEFAFTVLSPGTIFEGAVLEIAPVDVTLACPSCGAESVVTEIAYFCPLCGARARVIKGTELYIDYFEGDDGTGEGENSDEGCNGAAHPAGERPGGA